MPFYCTIHFNIRSLSANHDGLTMLLSDLQHQFDVIGLSETKIKSNCDTTSQFSFLVILGVPLLYVLLSVYLFIYNYFLINSSSCLR